MANLKYYLPLFADLFRSNSKLTEAVFKSKNMIVEALQEEILALSIKILGGLILTAVIIFSLVSVGQQINILLLSMENGPYLSMGLFGMLAMLCAVSLYYLFKPKPRVATLPVATSDFGIDVNRILTNFYNGFAEGLEKPLDKDNESAVAQTLKMNPKTPNSPNHTPNTAESSAILAN